MNWLDIALLVILAVTCVMGILKGFVKQIIGIAAVIAGLVLASTYYWGLADVARGVIRSEFLANFLSFLFIFVCVLILGSLLAYLLTLAMKGPLAFINRIFGGLLGLAKGALVCGVIVFALTAFEVARPALGESRLAPGCYGITRAVINLIPRDLRDKFHASYRRIRESGGRYGQKI